MNTSDILSAFEALGFSVDIADGRLRVRPRDSLTPAIRTLIADHRADLIDAISTGPPEEPELDPEIIASVGLIWDVLTGCRRRLTTAEMRFHLAGIVEHYAATRDPVWLEAGTFWAAAIQHHVQPHPIDMETTNAPAGIHHDQDGTHDSPRPEAHQ